MLKLIYILTNRGRANDIILPAILKEIKDNKHFVMVLDESDATDKDKGLDGRKIFKLIKKNSKRKDFTIYESEDPHVNVGFIASNSLIMKKKKRELINKWDLRFPQGRSEHYKHYRLIVNFDFDSKLKKALNIPGISIISQHNSAFIRPFRRAIQSFRAMKLLTYSQLTQPQRASFLVRDQNTWIPGEGKLERILRKINKVESLTDVIDRKYNMQYLESDTGGLNSFVMKLYKSGTIDWLSKFINFADKIETIACRKGMSHRLGLRITPGYKEVDGLDHGMLCVTIKHNS